MQDRLQTSEYKTRPNGGRNLPAEYVDYSPENMGNAFAIKDAIPFGEISDQAVASINDGSIISRIRGIQQQIETNNSSNKGASVSNILDVTVVEDGVDAVFYDLNNLEDPSVGPWVSVAIEAGSGITCDVVSSVNAASAPFLPIPFLVYDDQGSIHSNGTFPTTPYSRWWFNSASVGSAFRIVPRDSGGAAAIFKVSTHSTSPFEYIKVHETADYTSILAGRSRNQNILLSGQTNNLAAAVGGVSAPVSTTIATFNAYLDLRFNTPLADGTNFYVEGKLQSASSFKTLSWYNLYHGTDKTINIANDGIYRANIHNSGGTAENFQLRIVNIGTVNIPANTISYRVIDNDITIEPASDVTYSFNVTMPAGSNTQTFLLPESFKPNQIKSFNMVSIRSGTVTNLEVTSLSFLYTTTANRLATHIGTPLIRVAEFNYGNEVGNVNCFTLTKDSAILQPLHGISITRNNTVSTATHVITLTY